MNTHRGPSIPVLSSSRSERIEGRPLLATGFSLIELIVVIVLMAIMVGIAAPRFFGRGDFEAPAFAQELASAARYAQKLAVVSGCPVDLTVTAASYSLHQATAVCSGTPTMTLAVKHPATGESFSGNAPTGIAVGGTLGTVRFSATGVPDAPANYTIGDLAVTIAVGSGYVEVQ